MMGTKEVLLLVGSTLFGLGLCEAGLRLWTPYGATAPAEQAAKLPEKPLDIGAVREYVAQLPAAPGTDRRWFSESPAPLERAPAGKAQLQRFRDFERRGLFGPQSEYIWNRYYLESERCNSSGLFHRYPDTVLVFEPPTESVHPRYRFPPNTTTIDGLVTNPFGLRGHPIALAKPPKTIRIAFLGASTTVGFHPFAFSYPEFVEYWLNRFAEANHYDVHFEILNGGREGINSEDIALILKDELLPLDPDLAVYYEGSNQFIDAANAMAVPHVPRRSEIDPKDPIVGHKVPELLRTHLAIGDLLDRALNGFNSAGEPRKPAYRLEWPKGVDERNPDPDSPALPLQLPAILKDLDSMRQSLDSIGAGPLVVSSFEWLAQDGLPLSPTRHAQIYSQLNTVLWPLRYSDIHRLADFQNRVFRNYAKNRGLPFLDIANAMPQDPNLFIDAIHVTEDGERVMAWIAFQQLAPVLRQAIESRQLPRIGGGGRLPPSNMTSTPMSTRCQDPTGPLDRVPGAVSLSTIVAEASGSVAQGPGPVKVTTSSLGASFAAQVPLHVPAGFRGPGYVWLRARVLKGQVGIGVLDSQSHDFQTQKPTDPTPGMIDVYLPLIFPHRADLVEFTNAAQGETVSEILIEDMALMTPSNTRR